MVNLVILLVNAACVVVQEDAVAVVRPDSVGAQVMGEVLVGGPLGTAVCHLVDVATAGLLLIVGVRRFLMLMEMALGNDAEAEVDFESLVLGICDC